MAWLSAVARALSFSAALDDFIASRQTKEQGSTVSPGSAAS